MVNFYKNTPIFPGEINTLMKQISDKLYMDDWVYDSLPFYHYFPWFKLPMVNSGPKILWKTLKK